MIPIEIVVYSHLDPFTRIEVLNGRLSPQFLEEIRGVGGGKVTLNLHDEKLLADPTLIQARNILRFFLNGVCVGGIVISDKKAKPIDASADIETIEITGTSFRGWLEDAVVYPENGIKKSSFDDRNFNFSSARASWYVPAQWTNPVNVKQWGDIPSSPWRYAPKSWPDVPNAWWVWSSMSDSSAPAGDNYFRYEFTTTGEAKYSLFMAADDHYSIYIDGQLNTISRPEDSGWVNTERVDFDLSAGDHVIAIKVTNKASTPAALIAALFKAGDAALEIPATLITYTGKTGDTNWKVAAYPDPIPAWTVGEILLTLLEEAAVRDVRFTGWIDPTFTENTDSYGNTWPRELDWSFPIGTSLANVVEKLEELSCDVWIDPLTLELHAAVKRGVDRSVYGYAPDGITVTRPILQFEKGKNLKQSSIESSGEIKNSLIIQAADGWTSAEDLDSDSLSKYGRIEALLDTDSSSDLAKSIAGLVFEQKSNPEEGATYEIIPIEGHIPWVDFQVGDWVLAPNDVGLMVKRRVMSISVKEDSSNGQPLYEVEFDTIFRDSEDRLNRWISKMGGGSMGGQFANSGGGSNSPIGVPTVPSPGTPLEKIPVKVQNLSATSIGMWEVSGAYPRSRITLNFDPVTVNTDGSATVPFAYEIWGYETEKSPSAEHFLTRVFTNQAIFDNIEVGLSWTYRIRAINTASGTPGAFSDAITHVASPPNTPMPSATAPVLSTRGGTIIGGWDGNLVGPVVPPPQFRYVYPEIATAAAGPYTPIASAIERDGRDINIVGLTIGTRYWVRFIAVDGLGLKSSPSAASDIVVVGVDLGSLASDVTNAIEAASEAAADALDEANVARAASITAQNQAQNAWNVASVALKGTVIEYAKNTSESTTPTTGWSTTPPTRTPGSFIWERYVFTYGDDSTTTTDAVLTTGNTGTPGSPGAPVYTWLKYADSPTTGMSDLPDGKAYMGLAFNKSSSTESSNYADYSWSLIQGDQGLPGDPGDDGVQLYTWVKYATSSTGAGISDDPTGKAYIGFAYNKTTATESNTPGDYTWSLIQGEQGIQGNPGSTGVGISGATVSYQVSASGTVTPTGTWNSSVPAVPAGQFLWTRTITNYTNSTSTTTYSVGGVGANGAPGANGVSVTGAAVTYQVGSSGTTAPTGTWNSSVPTVPAGQFLWTRTITSYSNSTSTTAYAVSQAGANGANGSPGANSYFHVAYATNSTGTAGFSTTDPSGKTYVGTYSDNTAADSTDPARYDWMLVKGADGSNGKGISSSVVTYQVGASGTTAPTGTWNSSVPSVPAGQFLWTRTVLSFTDGASTTSYAVSQAGATGAPGTNGVSVTGAVVTYQVSTSGTTTPTGTWNSSVPSVPAGQFLWTRTITSYSNSTSTTAYAVSQAGANGANGTPGANSYFHVAYATNSTGTAGFSTTDPTGKTYVGTYSDNTVADSTDPSKYDWMLVKGADGATGKGIASTVVTYQAGASATTAPTGSWVANPPAVTAGQYLWTRTVITFTDSASTTTYSVARQGVDGAAGVGVSGTEVRYQIGTSGTTAPTGSWLATVPATTAGQFLWTRTVTSYTSGGPTTAYSVAAHGQTGATGNGVTGSTVRYQIGTSGTTAPTGTWLSTIPSTVSGEFLWTRTVTSYTTGADTTAYSVAAHGGDGRGLVKVEPLFRAMENYAPSLYGPTVPVEVRRNLVTRPNPSQSLTGWQLRPSAVSDGGAITGGRKLDIATALTLGQYIALLYGNVPVTPGSVLSGSIVIRNTGAVPVSVALQHWWVVNNNSTQGASVTVPAGEERELRFDGSIVPAGESSVSFRIVAGAGGLPSGSSIAAMDGWTVEFAPVAGSRFNPDMPSPDPDMTARWIGAANASESVLEGQHPVGFTDSKVISIVTADGAKLRQIPTEPAGAGGADAFTRVDVAASVLQAAFTVAATLTLPAPLSGGLEHRGRKIVAYSPEIWTASAPNVAGTYPLRLEASARTSTYQVRLYHGGRAGSGDAYWSNIGVFAGTPFDYTTWQMSEPLFDKNLELWRVEKLTYTDGVEHTEPTRVTSWDGVADAQDNTVTNQTIEYAVNTSTTTAPTSGWVSTQPSRTAGQVIWMRVVITYGDGGTSTSAPAVVTGDQGNAGNGVTGSTVTYQVSSSGTTTPTGTWNSSVPSVPAGQFLWTRTIITYSDATTTTTYSVSQAGATGAAGSTGVSVTSFQIYYFVTSAAGSAPPVPTASVPPAPWTTTEPNYAPNTALWATTRVGFSNSTFSYTPVTKVSSYAAAMTAQATADGKNTVWYGAVAPAGTGHKVNDVWFDSANGNRINTWNGTNWTQAQFGTNAIANLAITNTLLASGIDAAKITVGVLNADRIAANSLSVQKLAVGNFENVLDDPGFEQNNTLFWNNGSAKVTKPTTNPRTGSQCLRMVASTAAYEASRHTNAIRVEADEEWVFGGWVRREGAAFVAGAVELSVAFGDTEAVSTGTAAVASSPDALTTTYTFVFGVWKVPANTKFVKPRIVMRADTGNTNAYLLDDVTFYKRVPGDLIVDGAITAGKIAAESVFASHIQAGAVSSEKIQAGAIIAGKIGAEAIVAENIKASTITSNEIATETIKATNLVPNIGDYINISGNVTISTINSQISGVHANIGNIDDQLIDIGTRFSFDTNGVTVSKPGSPYSVVVTNDSVQIKQLESTVSTWTAGKLVVKEFEGESVLLGNHSINKSATGTVVRALG